MAACPRAELADAIRQVAQPKPRSCRSATLSAGDSVGYNATFTAPAPMRVGVVSLGYADGYPALLVGPGQCSAARTAAAAGSRPGVDGHDGGRPHRRAGTCRGRLAGSATMTLPASLPQPAACRNMNC